MKNVALSEIATFLSGKTPSKSKPEFWTGHIPWVSPKDMRAWRIKDTQDHISSAAVTYSSARLVGPETVLIVARSSILVRRFPIAMADIPLAFNQDIRAICVDPRHALPEYVAWFLRAREQDILRSGVKRGTTVYSLVPGYLESIRLRLPSHNEQRRIVNILNQAAGLQQLASEAQATVRELLPALFADRFGDPILNDRGWPIMAMGEAGDVLLGRRRSRHKASQLSRPCLRVANVQEDRIDISDVRAMDLNARDFGTYRLEFGDILLNEGQSHKYVGRPAMWRDETNDCCFENSLLRFRARPTHCTPTFAYQQILMMYRGGAFMGAASMTSNIAHLSRKRFAALPFICPPLPLQRQFDELAAEIETQKTLAADAATSADAALQSLLAQVFGSTP